MGGKCIAERCATTLTFSGRAGKKAASGGGGGAARVIQSSSVLQARKQLGNLTVSKRPRVAGTQLTLHR